MTKLDPNKTFQFKMILDFDFPMEINEFDGRSEYESYNSTCREANLAVGLERLRLQVSRMGMTHGEWTRVLAEKVFRGLKNMP